MARISRGKLKTRVDVEIYVYEVLDEISTDDLLAYIKERDKTLDLKNDATFAALVSEAYDHLIRNDTAMCKLVLEQALFPKFKTIADCVAKLSDVRKTRP